MSDFLASKAVGLNFSGLRVGPLDPKSKVPKVGSYQQYALEDPQAERAAKFLNKERSGFSGGFKIPEEQRIAKMGRKIKHLQGEDSEDHEEVNKTDITKDEILAQLQLGSSQAAGGMGKHGTGSKTALTKDLMENLEKELEKLKRTEENIKVRKHIALKGDRSILDETEDDRKRAKDLAVEDEVKAQGNNVIHADQKRIQVMRHRVGQLDSVKAVPYEELEEMRKETAERLKVLEDQYWGKKDAQGMGERMREKYKQYGTSTETTTDSPDKIETAPSSILKQTPKAGGQSLAKPKFSGARTTGGASRSKSTKKQRSPSPLQYSDPRQQMYQAKFEKYKANKDARMKHEEKIKERKPQQFDIYTRGPNSPNKKNAKRCQAKPDPTDPTKSGKYNAEDLVPAGQGVLSNIEIKREQQARTDPFGALGVGAADKMTFFLLKWVFNAIKHDSAEDDPKFKGQSFVSKADLVKQLAKNPELMKALDYSDQRQLADGVKLAASRKEGFMAWSEFLDFFFLKGVQQKGAEGNDWWNQLDSKGNYIVKAKQQSSRRDEEDANADKNKPAHGSPGAPGAGHSRSPGKRPVKVTAQIKMLQESRADRAEREVEEEFRQIAADKKGKQGQPAPKANSKKVPEYDSLDTGEGEGFGFSREKSKNLLLSSQIEVMKEVFERLDKYNEGILRRSDFVMALRTDVRVIDFIDCDSVKKAYSSIVMTLDAVLLEIEKDERYDQGGASKNQINHKEFLTWREFLNYFNDYQDIEARNKKQSQIQQSQAKAAQKDGDEADNGQNEMKSLMEQEKDRRLQELPKIREADQIDINEKQLQLIKDIYDSVPRAGALKDNVNVLTFFLTIRKDPQIRAINTAIARDPAGCSRIPKETFQEVFDRMERELQQKQVDWSTVVEFFTKRGRPLSKDEVLKLVDEDQRERELEMGRKRAVEEAQQRSQARIMGDLEEEEDFETQQMRQKAEQRATNDELDKLAGISGSGNEDLDQREGEYSPGLDRHQIGDLSRTKLTNKDYMKRAHSAKASQKGKCGLTVPKPFGFDTRDKHRPKTIRDTWLENEYKKKQMENDELVKRQFRSKPIPPEVLIPRYNNILEADQARRQNVRAESAVITKQREQPFSFWEREKHNQAAKKARIYEYEHGKDKENLFKANPIPRACSVLIYDEKLKRENRERDERINANAKNSINKAKMPECMQKYAEKKKEEQKQGGNSKLQPTQYSFKPDIGPPVTAKQLEEQQRKFQKELAKKKGQKTGTQQMPFNFSETKERNLERKKFDELRPVVENQSEYDKKMAALAERAKMSDSISQMNPPSTKAVSMSQLKRRDDIQNKRKQEEIAKKVEEERIEKQNALKSTVQSALKSKFGKSSDQVISEKAKQLRKDMRAQEAKQKAIIEEAKKKAARKPMLLEQSQGDLKDAANLTFLKATVKMISLLKDQGEQPEKFLTEEQKELMENEELRQKLKNQGKK